MRISTEANFTGGRTCFRPKNRTGADRRRYRHLQGVTRGGLVVITLLTFGMISCGPSRREHERMVSQVQALEEEVEAKDGRIEYLESELRKTSAQLAEKPEVIEKVKVEKVKGTIRFTILNEVLFQKGSYELQGEGLAALEHLIQVIKEEYPDRNIVIEGHTDDQPYREPEKFSNWDLSALRSLAVLKYFEERGLPSERLSVAAYGPYRPVADNSTEQGRRQNRRAVVVVQPPESSVERAPRAGQEKAEQAEEAEQTEKAEEPEQPEETEEESQ